MPKIAALSKKACALDEVPSALIGPSIGRPGLRHGKQQDENQVCEICWSEKNEESLLLCDSCNVGYEHFGGSDALLTPVLRVILPPFSGFIRFVSCLR